MRDLQPLINALLDQEQADEDGVFVRVSREACDHAAAELTRLQQSYDHLVFVVMRGSHREARDIARQRFVEIKPEGRAQVAKLDEQRASVERLQQSNAALVELAKYSASQFDLHGNVMTAQHVRNRLSTLAQSGQRTSVSKTGD